MVDKQITELIAIGASVSANCQPCVKYHVSKARQMNIEDKEIQRAIKTGKMVRKGAADQMDKLLENISKEF